MTQCAANMLGAGELTTGLLDAAAGVKRFVDAATALNQAAQAGDSCGVVSGILRILSANINLQKGIVGGANAVNPIKEITDATACLLSAAKLVTDVICLGPLGACAGLSTGPGGPCDSMNDVISLAGILQNAANGIATGEIVFTGITFALDGLKLGVENFCSSTPASGPNRPRRAATAEVLAQIQTATDALILEAGKVSRQLTDLAAVTGLVRSNLPALRQQLSDTFIAAGGFRNGYMSLQGGGLPNYSLVGDDGLIVLPVLLPDTVYRLSVIANGIVGHATFLSSPPGITTPFPLIDLAEIGAHAADADQDELPDAVEAIAGTDPLDPDTDHDGEIDGRDPMPLAPRRLQVISKTPTGVGSDDAFQCVAEGNHVYVAAGLAGLLIYEWDPAGSLKPVGKLTLGLPAISVNALSVEDSIAAVTDGATFWIIDVADPLAPRIIHSQKPATGRIQAVYVRNGLVYVINNTESVFPFKTVPDQLSVYAATTGAQTFSWQEEGIYYHQLLPLPDYSVTSYANVVGVRADRDHVYLLKTQHLPILLPGQSVPMASDSLSVVSAFTSVTAGFAKLGVSGLAIPKLSEQDFAARLELTDRTLYLGSLLSWRSVDVSNPAALAIAANPQVIQSSVLSLAPDGNHSLLTVTSFAGEFSNAVTIYDTADSKETARVVETLSTGESGESSVTLHDGYALVSSYQTSLRVAGTYRLFPGGISVLRFTDRDTAGIPPTAAIVPPVDEDPATPEINLVLCLLKDFTKR